MFNAPVRAWQSAPTPVGETSARFPALRRSPAAAPWYALAILLVVGGPAAAVFLLGTPELALPSEWSEARARVADGSYPARYIVDIVSGILALAWAAGLWSLLAGVLKQQQGQQDGSTSDETDPPITDGGSEPDEPWYRQGSPIFDEPFSDEYPRVVVPPDDMIARRRAAGLPVAARRHDRGRRRAIRDAAARRDGRGHRVSDAEIIGGARGSDPDDPPMIVPVRAYYFTRAEDTLRSISAQFLHTPKRWEELRSLNAASPGVAAVGPDTLLPTGTALALPGDPLPWGKPDPVYLWTLAEKFLFTAWGREPTPEEVVPFWRGLTSGTQLEARAPPARPEHLAAPVSTEPSASEAAHEPAPTPTEPPAPSNFLSPLPPVPGMEPSTAPTDFAPPPPITPPAYESPVPPTHAPPPAPAAYQPPPPAHQSPVPPTHAPPPAPAAYQPPPPAHQSPVPPTHEPPPYESPVPPSHEPPPYESPVPPSHEPPPPLYESAVAPTHAPPPPAAPATPGLPDFGPIEPEVPYVEAEAPRMPSFMPSLTGAETAAPTPEAEVVASSNRSLAGTAIGDAMMLWQLSRIRRRRDGRPDAVDPMEESLRQSARVDTLNLIEAAMRHLRAVTVGRLREKPAVLAVRVGTYGFEVLLNRPAQPPEGWQTASGGYVLELPQGVTAEDFDVTAQGPTLCPALVPVGDTMEGPLLLNVEEIGCLIVSGPGSPSVSLLNAVVGTLGSSPLAGDIRIITVGLDTPAGLPGWERVHSTSFDSPQLEELLSTAHTGSGASLDILVVGPGNDLLIQRAGQVTTTPGSRLALVGATSSVAARWPWRIHVDETTTAVVHPIACTMAAAQAMAPAMSQLLSESLNTQPTAPPRF